MQAGQVVRGHSQLKTQSRPQGSGAFVLAHPAVPKWHKGWMCILQFQPKTPLLEGKERRRGQIPDTLAGKRGSLPEPQQPGLMPPTLWKHMLKPQTS